MGSIELLRREYATYLNVAKQAVRDLHRRVRVANELLLLARTSGVAMEEYATQHRLLNAWEREVDNSLLDTDGSRTDLLNGIISARADLRALASVCDPRHPHPSRYASAQRFTIIRRNRQPRKPVRLLARSARRVLHYA